MNVRNLTLLLLVWSLFSCTKEEEASVLKAPINFLQPSTDPANISIGAPVKYDIRFINDEYIDSVMISYQIDSLGIGYSSSAPDSLIEKIVYLGSARKNEQSVSRTFTPHLFPSAGKKIYLIAKMRSANKSREKSLPLIVN